MRCNVRVLRRTAYMLAQVVQPRKGPAGSDTAMAAEHTFQDPAIVGSTTTASCCGAKMNRLSASSAWAGSLRQPPPTLLPAQPYCTVMWAPLTTCDVPWEPVRQSFCLLPDALSRAPRPPKQGLMVRSCWVLSSSRLSQALGACQALQPQWPAAPDIPAQADMSWSAAC